VSETVAAVRLDEEAKGLLRRILERTAYRQIMVANIRGHGLKYLIELGEKDLLAADLQAGLVALREVERIYGEVDGRDLPFAVRDAMERIPYPYSRMELATCLSLVSRAERLVAASYTASRVADVAALAARLSGLERRGTGMLEAQLAAFCAEEQNRPSAQQFLNRWLAIALAAFGRPGTTGDQRAITLGLRTLRVHEIVERFLEEAAGWSAELSLTLPDLDTLGLDLKRSAKDGKRS
jgi:hypothetical protein